MNLRFEKKKVIEALHVASAHLGLKMQAVELLASTGDDAAVTEHLWHDAVNELMGLLRPWASLLQCDDVALFELNMPSNWDSALAAGLEDLCMRFLQNSMFVHWLEFIKPDMASFYAVRNKDTATNIVGILSQRMKPKRQ